MLYIVGLRNFCLFCLGFLWVSPLCIVGCSETLSMFENPASSTHISRSHDQHRPHISLSLPAHFILLSISSLFLSFSPPKFTVYLANHIDLETRHHASSNYSPYMGCSRGALQVGWQDLRPEGGLRRRPGALQQVHQDLPQLTLLRILGLCRTSQRFSVPTTTKKY